jgi:hypothetical protein
MSMYSYKFVSAGHESPITYYLYHEEQYTEEQFESLCRSAFTQVIDRIADWNIEEFNKQLKVEQRGAYHLERAGSGFPMRLEMLADAVVLCLIDDFGFRAPPALEATCAFWGWEDFGADHFWHESRGNATERLFQDLRASGTFEKMANLAANYEAQMRRDVDEPFYDEELDDVPFPDGE